MMLSGMSRLHRANLMMWLSDTATIERQVSAGIWTPVETDVRCVVQQPRSSQHPIDPNRASAAEARYQTLYALDGTDILPGDRVLWHGDEFIVESAATDRTNPFMVKASMFKGQSALVTEPVIFYRRVDGETVTVGTYNVRFTESEPVAPMVSSDRTAVSRWITGVMIGANDLTAIQVGDRFARGSFPGQVTAIDDSDENWIALSYRMESEAP